ncbi:MAG: hypothetical protein QGF00_30620 [Planctomycetota bacterium]|jgi:hypothetical protein|nr:hypothetical protein [Planctomycetota bacterium]MDP7253994.1 hypothetical protein [Planctomycetota bacterium]
MDFFDQDVSNKSSERLQLEVNDFQRTYGNELETYLVGRCCAESTTWARDYSSIEAYNESVQPHRALWQDILGRFDEDAVSETEEHTRCFHEGDDFQAEWVKFEFLPGVHSLAVVATPSNSSGQTPVVICQHGIGSSPFHIFGHLDKSGAYGDYGTVLLKAGFAVVAPVNRLGAPARNRLERIAHLAGGTLYGLECFKLERLIDYLETRDDMDASRLGMSGLSLGGAATLLCTPVVDRIKAACSAAWFNHRRKKMVIIDPRYSCFLTTSEEHAFIPGWMPEFSDSDLVSLICPRPFMSQTGKADGIAWWPFVLEEWERSKSHYEKLGISDRAEMVLHDSGHEVVPSKMVEFFTKWL